MTAFALFEKEKFNVFLANPSNSLLTSVSSTQGNVVFPCGLTAPLKQMVPPRAIQENNTLESR